MLSKLLRAVRALSERPFTDRRGSNPFADPYAQQVTHVNSGGRVF